MSSYYLRGSLAMHLNLHPRFRKADMRRNRLALNFTTNLPFRSTTTENVIRCLPIVYVNHRLRTWKFVASLPKISRWSRISRYKTRATDEVSLEKHQPSSTSTTICSHNPDRSNIASGFALAEYHHCFLAPDLSFISLCNTLLFLRPGCSINRSANVSGLC